METELCNTATEKLRSAIRYQLWARIAQIKQAHLGGPNIMLFHQGHLVR